jgi:hypothetical protein
MHSIDIKLYRCFTLYIHNAVSSTHTANPHWETHNLTANTTQCEDHVRDNDLVKMLFQPWLMRSLKMWKIPSQCQGTRLLLSFAPCM